jgi:hypothetical protein
VLTPLPRAERRKAVWGSRRLFVVLAPLAGAALLTLGLAARASAQTKQCAGCHFASLPEVASHESQFEWERSTHNKNKVGCESCHGGDPWALEKNDAHRGVLASANPNSPVHASNLAQTCAPCHQAAAVAFERSVHQMLARADDPRAPTCVTCHGSASAKVPTPAALETQCASCHTAGSVRGDYPAKMKAGMELLRGLREQADELSSAIARVQERSRRVPLMVNLFDTRTALKEATARLHAFDFPAMTQRAAIVAKQLDLLSGSVVVANDDQQQQPQR